MEERLSKLFGTLNAGKIEYCLLRGYKELGEYAAYKEVDLLVHPQHLKKLRAVALDFGFCEMPSWGHAPHHFYVVFDKCADCWIKLDVVTETVYGTPVRYLNVPIVRKCLSKRVKRGQLFVAPSVEECIMLLLHCLLDKGRIQNKHSERLAVLTQEIEKNPSLAQQTVQYVQRYLAPALEWKQIVATFRTQKTEKLLAKRGRLERKLFVQDPVGGLKRKLGVLIMRRARPVLSLLVRRGMTISLMAPDGAGKSTIANSLLDDRILKVRMIYMGSNLEASTIGLPTTRWLKRQRKKVDASGNAPWRLVLRTLNYINRLTEQWLRCSAGIYHKSRGRFVVYDRFVYDNFLAPPATTLGKRIRRAIILNSCVSPDLVLLLDAPGDVLFARKGEHSPEYLERQRQVFLGLKEKIPNMKVVDVTLPYADVRREVLDRIWTQYRLRVCG